LTRIRIQLINFDADQDEDPGFQNDADPCGSGSTTLVFRKFGIEKKGGGVAWKNRGEEGGREGGARRSRLEGVGVGMGGKVEKKTLLWNRSRSRTRNFLS
jgi:hypothetical protein